MGLFNVFKKKPHEKTIRISPEINELQEKLNRQDKILSQINEAERRYKESGDLDKYMNFYRDLFANGNCFEIRGSWALHYPETLVKEKMYDEAWRVLNQLYLVLPEQRGRIYNMRYQILKAENKHHEDAIFDLMAAALYKTEGTNSPLNFYFSSVKPDFLKKAKPLAKKAGFSEVELEHLAFLIEKQVSNKIYSDSKLEKLYSAFLKDRS